MLVIGKLLAALLIVFFDKLPTVYYIYFIGRHYLNGPFLLWFESAKVRIFLDIIEIKCKKASRKKTASR